MSSKSPKRISKTQHSLPSISPPEIGQQKKRSVPIEQAKPATKPASDLFIVDNSEEYWKVADYLRGLCDISKSLDIASGYFEIGALLTLDGCWQKMDPIRILMGDEVSKRTQQAFNTGLGRITGVLEDSIERAKEENDFLKGVPAIVQAIQGSQIICKVYREKKFHAKTYISYSKFDFVTPTALVGSSNFTYPGLNENIELNVRILTEVPKLQQWYEHYWNEAEDVTPQILQVIQRHVREYTPFKVYAKSYHLNKLG